MTDTNTARITVANQKGGAGKTTDVIHAGGRLLPGDTMSF